MRDYSVLLFIGAVIVLGSLWIGSVLRGVNEQALQEPQVIRRPAQYIAPPKPFTYNATPGTLYVVFVPDGEEE